MRKAYIIKTALILISNKLRRTLLLLALNTVCFLLFLLGLFLYEQQNYNRNSCEKLLSSGVEGTGYLVLENAFKGTKYQNREKKFRERLYQYEGITAIGAVNTGSVPYMPELQRLQKKYDHSRTVQESNSDGSLYMTYVQPTFLELNPISLAKGKQVSLDAYPDETYQYLYLGWDYHEIPVGTKYRQTFDSGLTLTYEVAGIMKKGTRLVSEEIFDVNMESVVSYKTMDNAIIVINKMVSIDRELFAIDTKHYSMNEVRYYIKKLAAQCGCEVSIATLEAAFNRAEADSAQIRKYVRDLFILVSFVTIGIMMCMQVIDFMSREYEYGVMRISGFTQKNLIQVFAVQNIAKLLCAYAVAGGILARFLQPMFAVDETSSLVIQELLLGCVFGKGLLLFAGLFVISMLVPVYVVKKCPVVEMLKRR